MRKILITLTLTALLAACNTVAGVGKDITSSADWTKEKMGSGVDLNNPPADTTSSK